jgi:RimJ/RimL family protein N-acetyltransferase
VNIALADNQRPGVQAIANSGAAVALNVDALQDPDQIAVALRAVIDNYASYSERAAELCDGVGAARVIAAMSGQLRAVTQADARLIFDWRNQKHIREASLNSAPLVWENHVSYLKKVLADPTQNQWLIYQESGKDLGLVNANRHPDGFWEWGFYIGAQDAPSGAGRRMLSRFLRHLSLTEGFAGVRAAVLSDNHRSRHLHEALGFLVESDKASGELHLRLTAKVLNERMGTS